MSENLFDAHLAVVHIVQVLWRHDIPSQAMIRELMRELGGEEIPAKKRKVIDRVVRDLGEFLDLSNRDSASEAWQRTKSAFLANFGIVAQEFELEVVCKAIDWVQVFYSGHET